MARREKVITEIGWGNDTKSEETLVCKVSQIEERLKIFPNPYIGNKRKLLVDIFCFLDENNIEFESVLDLFSGSSYVSMAMKLMDKKVISNDLLSCSCLNAIAFVANKDIKIVRENLDFLFQNESNQTWTIDNKYLNRFDKEEIKIISNYYNNAYLKWGHPLASTRSALAIVHMQNYIIENCFVGGRLNSGQILAKYDHRINHARNKGCNMFSSGIDFSFKGMKIIDPIYPEDSNEHFCYNMDATELLKHIKPNVDLCYIDPPYGGSQSDYSFMYSFFEENIHRQPYDDIVKGMIGDKRYVNKKNYEENFDELIKGSSYIPRLLISYNNSSWADIDKIEEVIKRYRKKVVVKDLEYEYNYRDSDKKNKSVEYLILAE